MVSFKKLSTLIGDDLNQDVNVEQLLQVKVDQNLSWWAQIDKIFTVSMIVAKFRKVKPQLQTYARTRIVQAFIIAVVCKSGKGF